MTAAEGAPQVLFEGDHIQLLHFPRPSGRMLVSFDIMHARANGRNAFARDLCARLGYGLLAVVPRYPCWYPAAEMERIAELCRSRATSETIAYGASMGGYGALRWGRALGATHVLACSPQVSIDPDFTGNSDRRYHRHFRPDLNRDMQARPGHWPAGSLVLFDPTFRPDALHGCWLAAQEGVRAIALPHMRHGTARCLAGSAQARAVFDDLVDGNFAAIRRRLLDRRKELALYRLNLADHALGHGRPDLAARIAAGAREAEPVGYQMLMGKLAKLGGDRTAAAAHFREALALKPGCPQASFHLSRLQDKRPAA